MPPKNILRRGLGFALVHDPEGAADWFPGGLGFRSNLNCKVTRGGQVVPARELRRPSLMERALGKWDPFAVELDLGSGLVTNVGVTALANDFNWAQNAQTIKLANWHATGTGTNAAAATDIALQTLAAPTTANAVSGAQSLVSAANSQTYKTVATISYTSSLAITEWGLHTAQVLSATTGTPFTAATATTATVTATPYSASSGSVQGEQQLVVVPGTTTVYGLILSNTTSVLTIPAWYKVADGTAGSTPGNTETFVLKPVLWDRKVFSAVNVINGDSIAFSYSVVVNAGG